jgi:hypothetical protein
MYCASAQSFFKPNKESQQQTKGKVMETKMPFKAKYAGHIYCVAGLLRLPEITGLLREILWDETIPYRFTIENPAKGKPNDDHGVQIVETQNKLFVSVKVFCRGRRCICHIICDSVASADALRQRLMEKCGTDRVFVLGVKGYTPEYMSEDEAKNFPSMPAELREKVLSSKDEDDIDDANDSDEQTPDSEENPQSEPEAPVPKQRKLRKIQGPRSDDGASRLRIREKLIADKNAQISAREKALRENIKRKISQESMDGYVSWFQLPEYFQMVIFQPEEIGDLYLLVKMLAGRERNQSMVDFINSVFSNRNSPLTMDTLGYLLSKLGPFGENLLVEIDGKISLSPKGEEFVIETCKKFPKTR